MSDVHSTHIAADMVEKNNNRNFSARRFVTDYVAPEDRGGSDERAERLMETKPTAPPGSVKSKVKNKKKKNSRRRTFINIVSAKGSNFLFFFFFISSPPLRAFADTVKAYGPRARDLPDFGRGAANRFIISGGSIKRAPKYNIPDVSNIYYKFTYIYIYIYMCTMCE